MQENGLYFAGDKNKTKTTTKTTPEGKNRTAGEAWQGRAGQGRAGNI